MYCYLGYKDITLANVTHFFEYVLPNVISVSYINCR